MLYEYLKKLESEEFKKSGLSLFDLAMLLKVSSPAAEFDKKVGKDIMKEALAFVYDYMKTIVLGDDLDWVYGNFVYEQAMLFDKNVDWYYDNWKDNFSGYVDDLLQIAANDIENKKINKQHITVDNSCILLYTVYQEEDTYEDYNQQFIDGTDL